MKDTILFLCCIVGVVALVAYSAGIFEPTLCHRIPGCPTVRSAVGSF